MDYLLAKTKGRNGRFFKVISNEEIFDLPEDLEDHVQYNGDYKLEDDEWFGIENFSAKEFCIDFLTQRFIAADYIQLTINEYLKIDYLCSIQDDIYYFQKLSSSQLIRKKWFQVSDAPQLVTNEPIIVINKFANAIYKKDEDILYFKKLTSISSIFNGIDVLYREATDQDTEDFLGSSYINLGDGYDVNNVKKANRKRIALAMDTMSNFNEHEQNSIFDYIRGYCENLEFDEDASNFKISTEDDLKKLLYGIEQRYYTTPLGNEKRLANSIIKI